RTKLQHRAGIKAWKGGELLDFGFSAFAFDGVTHGAFELLSRDLAFDKEILGARAHRFKVDTVIIHAREQDHGRIDADTVRLFQEIEAAVSPEPEIDQVNVVATLAHLFEAGLIRGCPVNDKTHAINFEEKIARDDEIIFIVVYD